MQTQLQHLKIRDICVMTFGSGTATALSLSPIDLC
jgi:hypothetical protein